MNTTNDGIQAWTIAHDAAAGTAKRIRVTSVNNTSIFDISNSNFTLTSAPSITVTSPNGGENWQIGSTYNITWTSTSLTGNVNIEVNGNFPNGAWEPLFMNTTNDGIQSWIIALDAVAGTAKRIRVTSVNNTSIFDISNSNFTLTSAPSITVTSPNGGENWQIGSTYNITWTSTNLTGNVNVQVKGDYPNGEWENLFMNTPNDGIQAWTIALDATAGTTKRIKVTSVNNASIFDISNSNFTLGSDPDINVRPTSITINQPIGTKSNSSNNNVSAYENNANNQTSYTSTLSNYKGKILGEYKQGRLIVKFADSISVDINSGKTNNETINALNKNYSVIKMTALFPKNDLNIDLKESLGLNSIFSLQVPESIDIKDMLESYNSRYEVIYAEPDYLYYANIIPPDPIYPSQWGLNNTGQAIPFGGGNPVGTPGADINVEAAWDIQYGNSGIIVAVLDDGVDLSHPEFAGRLLSGFDFFDNDNDPNPVGNGAHGTACAGIVAAANNDVGVVGVAWGVSILPVRVLGSDGGTSTMVSNGIIYATDHGADVISMSLGSYSYSNTIQTAVNYAYAADVILFGGAGNYNRNNSTNPYYPADYTNCVSVGAMSPCNERKRSSSSPAELKPGVNPDPNGVTCDNEVWWGSNFGGGIDFLAPGVRIHTTDISGNAGYTTNNYTPDFNGTSSATPFASGVAALIRSQNPFLTNTQILNIMQNTCVDLGPSGYDDQTGFGRLDAYQALISATGNSFIISNFGTGGLTINSITDNKNWLSTSGNPATPFTINSNSSQLVDVDIDWPLVGSTQQTGTIIIASNDPDEPSVTVEVTAIPFMPDLKISAGSYFISQNSVGAGSNITASAAQSNEGSATAASGTAVGLWLSSAYPLNTSSATYLGNVTGFPAINANSSSIQYDKIVTIPASTPAGNYYLFFWADGGNCSAAGSSCNNCFGSVSESDECNNFASLTITVTSSSNPTITATPSSLNFNSVTIGECSQPYSYQLSGTNLTSNITITAPNGYTVSDSPSSGFSVSKIIPHSGGNVNQTTIYVKFCPLLQQPYTGTISNTSGVTTQPVSVSGTGLPSSGCTPPGQPTLTYGANSCPGAVASNVMPPGTTLTWNTVSGATGYKVYVSKYPYGSSCLLSGYNPYPCSNYSGQIVMSAALEPGMLYRWNMNATSDCSNESCDSPVSLPKYFYVPPTISPSASQTICAGGGVSFSTTAANVCSGGSVSYQWYRNSSLIPGETGTSYYATQSGTYYVQFNFSGSSGCNSASIQSSSVNVTVNPLPGSIGSISGPTNVSPGSINNYTVSAVSGLTYNWNYSGNGTLNPNGASCSLTPTSSGTLSVIASNSCGPSPTSSIPINVTSGATISTSPSSINFGDVTIGLCNPLSYQLTGSNLTSDITVTAPSGYMISQEASTGFNTSIIVAHTNGNINQTIHVMFCPLAVQPYNGPITNTSGTISQPVNATGYGSNQGSSNATIFINPANQTVVPGQAFTTTLEVGSVTNLGGFEVNIQFDKNLLQVESMTIGSFLGSTGRTIIDIANSFNNDLGTLVFAATTLGSTPAGPNGNGVLLTIQWTATSNLTALTTTEIVIQSPILTQPNGTPIPANLINGTVIISPCYEYDLNCDCSVDIIDITLIAFRYGSSQGSSLYNPAYDINSDGVIDIIDVTMVAFEYGWSCSKTPEKRTLINPVNNNVELLFTDPIPVADKPNFYSIDLQITDVEYLAAYDFATTFDPFFVEVLSVKTSDILSSGAKMGFEVENSFDNEEGIIRIAQTTMGLANILPNVKGCIMTIEFRSNTLTPEPFIISNGVLLDYNLKFIPYKFDDSNISSEVIDDVQFYPNPVDNTLNISVIAKSAGNFSISMYDATGKLIETSSYNFSKEGNNLTIFNMKNLARGIYLVKVDKNGKLIKSEKIVKN